MMAYLWSCLSPVILLLCLQAIPVSGQELNFIHYNTDNSALPHDICYRLMQDRKGYLWISTDNGLVRFDGLDMKIFRKGFRSPFIIATTEYDSTIMVSTWKGGVYQLKSDSVIRLRSIDSQNILNTNKILLYKDIVVLNSFNTTTFYRYHHRHHTLAPIDLFLKQAGNRISKLEKEEPLRQKRRADALKCFILEDGLFAYNSGGIFRLNHTVFEQVSGNSFDQVCQNGNNIYGIRRNCVYRLSKDFRAVKIYSFSKDVYSADGDIYGFTVLASGNVVLLLDVVDKVSGKKESKCLFANVGTNRITDLSQALKLKVFVSDILMDPQGGFWLSTYGQGLYHVSESRYRQYAGFDNVFVTDMIQDKNKRLYIGTQKGLYLFSDQTGRPKVQLLHAGYNVGHLFKNRKNEICAQSKIASYGITLTDKGRIKKGINYYSRSTFRYHIDGTAYTGIKIYDKQAKRLFKHIWDTISSPLLDSREDGRGRIWLASNQGLYYWDGAQHNTVLISHPILGKAIINKLLTDTMNGIWVGSSAGLFYLQNNKVIYEYQETNGLSNVHINTLLLHEGKLWIGTQNGLNILNLKSGNISVYKKHNGLIANDVTALALFSDSEVAIGSSKGITFINSEQADTHLQTTQLLLEHVLISDSLATSPIIARYNSHITVACNVISFLYPELTRFQYRLSKNDPWIETTNKSIVLTSLASGNYELQIRAKKYNGAWSETLSLRLQIKKPWWNTTLFYVIITVCIILCICWAVRYRERKVYRATILQQQFSELRLKALQARLNPHFISNTLSTIQFFHLTQDQEATNEYLTRFAHLTRLLFESSHNRFIFLKDELQTLVHYLSLEKIRFRDRFIYDIQVAPDIDTAKELIPGVLLQPFAENSINHGIAYLPKDQQGYVGIKITKQGAGLIIEITDNGIGRKRAAAIQLKAGKRYRSRSSEIMESVKQAINRLPGCHISISVADTYDGNGVASGTQVHIHCTINNQYLKTNENTDY